MKRFLIVTLLCVWYVDGYAQTAFYTSDGTKTSGILLSADENRIKVKLTENNGIERKTSRENILIAFNQAGNYLVIEDISTDESQSEGQITDFYKEKANPDEYHDIIFKAIPFEVIPCTIQSDLESVVNYKLLDGKSATISKENIMAIIKRDGSYELLKEITEVVLNLKTNLVRFRQLRVAKKSASAPATIPKPQPQAQLPALSPSPPAPVIAAKVKKNLTPEEQKKYKDRAKAKVEEFSSYLNVIIDTRRSRTEKDIAIKKATKMFIGGSTMEVGAINNPDKTIVRPIEEYLKRLSNLSYSNVKITYSKLVVIDDFEEDPQQKGNYWGMVSGEQLFEAGNVSDVTKKNYKVKLQPYQKLNESTLGSFTELEVLLGNVRVEVNP